jgi:Family of unknown function (DUF6338)
LGALSTSVAALAVLAIPDSSGRFLDSDDLAREGSDYLLTESSRSLATFLLVLLLSYGVAYAAALVVHRGRRPAFEQSSMWHQVLRVAGGDSLLAFATVELRDGRLVSGYVHAYSALPTSPDQMYLSLHAPIFAKRSASDEAQLLEDTFIVFRGDDIAYVGVKYQTTSGHDASAAS